MAAPRRLPGADAVLSRPSLPWIGLDPVDTDCLVVLAWRWATLAPDELTPDARGAVAERLIAWLRRLGEVLHAEPFRPGPARELGTQLLQTGLADVGRPRPEVADVLPASLRLLRREALSVLGPAGPELAPRLTEALDEIAAGFAVAVGGGRALSPVVPARGFVATERHYRGVFEQGGAGIVFVTLDGLVVDANPALCRIMGIDRLRRAQPLSDFIHPDDLTDVIERFQRLLRSAAESMRVEVRLVRPDGRIIWVRLIASLVRHPDGTPSHLMALIGDISERRHLRSQLEHASARDQLTRLPGPALAEQWLHRAFAPDGIDRVGICSLDLDGFEAVNDAFGFDVGDRLLLAVVGRLQFAAGDHLVTRSGSDAFTVLVADPVDVGDVEHLAERLQAALASPFLIGGRRLSITASAGVAEEPTTRSCAAEMLRSADVARSWAKAMGHGRRVVFDHRRDAGEAARFALVRGLYSGVDRGEFRVVYQPLVRLHDDHLIGIEALVRWQHPELGLIGPGRFIELAEQSGAIVPLGRWVLQTACAKAATWFRELGPSAPYVSVNVSPVQLAEAGWLDEVTAILDASGLPPDRLQLEITEQAVLSDEVSATVALSALRAAGVRLALDDFGTGYSSLAWLRRLPVHALKIDGSFVDGLRHPSVDPVDASIVKALIDMAHALGMEVTAEWVETAVQAERLEAMGCHAGQGHWFGDAGPGEWVPGLWRRSIGR